MPPNQVKLVAPNSLPHIKAKGGDGTQFLEIPGALANLGDHAQGGGARAPENHQEIIERGGDRARRGKAGRGHGKYRDQEKHEARHQQKPRRGKLEPEIALKFRVQFRASPDRPSCAK